MLFHQSYPLTASCQARWMDGWKTTTEKKSCDWKVSVIPCCPSEGPRNRSWLLQSGGHVEKDLRLVMWQGTQLPHTLAPQPLSHTSLSSQAPEIPRCGPTVSSGLLRVYFTEPGFVFITVESKCAGGMGEKSMGDVATVNHANTFLSVWNWDIHLKQVEVTLTASVYKDLPVWVWHFSPLAVTVSTVCQEYINSYASLCCL